jgi:hypothetical protein
MSTDPHTKVRLGALVLFLGLLACAHPAPSAVTGSGAVGGGATPPVTFGLDDLEGAWYGKLVPDSLARPERNYYVKIAAGDAVEAADSLGNQWLVADSGRSLDFTAEGALSLSLSSLIESNDLVLTAQMDDAMTTLAGTFSYLAPDGSVTDGTMTLVRSGGAGEFAPAVLEGAWTGFGTNDRGKRRSMEIDLAADGGVASGRIFHPLTLEEVHLYSAGSGTFAFSDDTVGRLDDVVVLADGGDVLTFDWLLVDAEGTLMGGPGFDTLLGVGVVTLGADTLDGPAE